MLEKYFKFGKKVGEKHNETLDEIYSWQVDRNDQYPVSDEEQFECFISNATNELLSKYSFGSNLFNKAKENIHLKSNKFFQLQEDFIKKCVENDKTLTETQVRELIRTIQNNERWLSEMEMYALSSTGYTCLNSSNYWRKDENKRKWDQILPRLIKKLDRKLLKEVVKADADAGGKSVIGLCTTHCMGLNSDPLQRLVLLSAVLAAVDSAWALGKVVFKSDNK